MSVADEYSQGRVALLERNEVMSIPSLTMNTGARIPQIGYGAYQVDDADAPATVSSVLEVGYRRVDTASFYGNEAGIGKGISSSGVPRDELFVTTKLWNTEQADARAAFEASLERLSLDWVDLYLIHWPAPGRGHYLDAWAVLEELHAAGLARAIGVSNFLPSHLEHIVALGGTVPAVNQIELHPTLQQRDVVRVNEDQGVLTEAWSPLAQGGILHNPAIESIAHRIGRTSGQVVLRWHVEQGRLVIPKTARRERMIENLSLFDFALTAQDRADIDGLECGGRLGAHPDLFD